MSPILGNANYNAGVEVAFWIEPEARGHGRMMIEAMEDAAREAGVYLWSMVSIPAIGDVGPMYEAMGYVKTETAYTKVL